VQTFQVRTFANSTPGGFAARNSSNTTTTVLNNPINASLAAGSSYWGRPQLFVFRGTGLATSANGVCRIQVGKTTADASRLAVAGIGIELYYINVNTNGVRLLAHNGSSLTVADTGLTIFSTGLFDYTLLSDGSGNVTLTINDGSPGSYTTSGGPTSGTLGAGGISFEASNGGDTSQSSMTMCRYVFATSY
jgi:hypothetical protein